MKNEKKFSTLMMVQLAVLIAITVIMGTTPLGTIRTPFLSVSLVTIPVAIAAIILGPIGGMVCGAAFGITSLINALTGTSGMMSILMTVNAFGAVFTIIVPRVLEGLLTALIFKAAHKTMTELKAGRMAYYVGAICCPLLNTLLFMSCIVLFFYNSDYVQGLVEKLGASNPIMFVVLLVGIQGLIEAVSCCIIGGTISAVLVRVFKKN